MTINPSTARVIWLIPLVIAAPLGLDICLPGIPAISVFMSSTPGMTQWIISGFVLCMSLSQLLAGPLVDTYGPQKIALTGGVIYLAGLLSALLVSGIHSLIFLRLVQGIGAGAMAVSVFATVPRYFQGPAIGRVFSIFNGMISFVPVTAPVIGGILTLRYGWQGTFAFLSGVVALCLLLAVYQPLPKNGEPHRIALHALLNGYCEVILHPDFQLGCLSSSFGFATQLIFFSSAPIVLIDYLHVPVDRFGYYFAVNALAITGGSLLTSRLLGKVSELRILFTGALFLLFATLGFILTQVILGASVWGYILSATAGSLGFALLMGAGASVALSPFTALSGTASGLMAAVQMSFSSLVAWWVIHSWDDNWKTMTTAYLILTISLVLQLLRAVYQKNKKQCCN